METSAESLSVDPVEAAQSATLPHEAVQQAVVQQEEWEHDSTEYLKRLLRDLIRSSRREQASVARQIEALLPDHLVQLADLEAKEFQRRQQKGAKTVLTLLPLLTGLVFLLSEFGSLPYNGSLVLLSVFCLAMAFGLAAYMPISAHKILYGILTKTDDTRLIGPLLLMLLPDPVAGTSALIDLQDPARRALTDALKSLLPRARQDTALTKDQMQVLLSLLERPYQDPHLTIHVLKALEQIGDETAIPIVERMTHETRRGIYAAVREAAQECLPYLQKRAEESRHARTLLRASSNSESVPAEMLLRPAANASPEAVEQLLRSTS